MAPTSLDRTKELSMSFLWRRPNKTARSQKSSRTRKSKKSSVRFRPKVEPLEARIALNYSFSATPFQWVNLVPGAPGVFTIIQYADDAAAPVDLGGNSFNFYGTTYTGATSIWASSNGLITFGSGDASFSPTDLTSNPNQASIAPLWYDLFKFSNVPGGPMLLAEITNNQLIIEWNQVRDWSTSNLLSFEAVLQLNTGVNPGNITINYLTTDYFGSGGGTVGIKDAGPQGPNMSLVAYRAQSPLVGNNEAILFSWINPILIPNISSISPGSASEGGAALGLTVNGSNFTSTSEVEVNGVAVSTTFVNGTQLQATLPASVLAEEGPLSITVFTPGPYGGTSNTQTFTVVDAALTATNATVAGTEGLGLNNVLVASFTDPGTDGTAADYTATVTWDDGNGQSHTSVGTIVAAANGTFNVYASNTVAYAEEGAHSVTVSISDRGGSTATASSTVNVGDAALTATGQAVSGVEGAMLSGVVATFSDADPNAAAGDFTAVITWGDGQTSTGTVTVNPSGGFNVTGSHTYAEEGNYSIGVQITDAGGATVSTTGSATVADAALTPSAVTVTPLEGNAFSGVVASFTDADPNAVASDFTATITWGDGHTSTGTVVGNGSGGFTVSGSNTYTEEGSFPISVVITDAGGASTTAASTANVADASLSASGTTVNPVEGNMFSGVVATFTDADPFGTAGDYTATINWGDGSSSSGTIVDNGNGTFSVTGSHTYADEGVTAVSVTVRDTGGSNTVASASSTANTGDAPLSGSGTVATATEGATFNGVVASFVDTDPAAPMNDYAAVIHWGDGLTSSATISSNGHGGYNVIGSHVYAEEGSYTLSVTINDKGGATATVSSTVNVGDAALTASGLTVNATEGAGFTGAVATFTDADPNGTAADFTATINWGDGTSSPGTITANGSVFTVMGTHTYAEEGAFAITVTIADAGGASTSIGGSATVADAGLTLTALNLTSTEGTAFNGLVGSFTDADPNAVASDFTATITWGDGHTSAGTIAANGSGGFNVSGTNTYAEEGSFPVSVQISDAGGASASANSTATVGDAALAATGTSIATTEGTSFSGAVASFTDVDPNGTATDYTATISWGDGTSSTGTITSNGSGGFTVSGTHTYAEEGKYGVSVQIADTTGTGVTANTQATVGDAALAATGATVNPTEGVSFSGVVASFTDADPNALASDYTATITWGDGTSSPGTIVANGNGGFNVTGSHTYADEGALPISVAISDAGGALVTASGTANVADASLTVTAAAPLSTEGNPFSGVVASFTDVNATASAADFKAIIYWGDGSTTAGVISANGSSFNVSGSHVYAEEGSYSIKVSVTDVGGADGSGTGSATVVDAASQVSANPVGATEGTAFTGVVATFLDANPGATAADFTATITWGDGHTSAGTVTSNGNGSFSVTGSNTYADEGSYAVSVTISDDGGATATASSTATVGDAALGASTGSLSATEGTAFTGVVATFTDANPNATAADFTATITWGDGHTSAGTVTSNGNGSFSVTGSNTYADEGSYSFSVKITDDGGASATVGGAVTVADASLTAQGAAVTALAGNSFSGVVASFTDGNANGSAADFSATITWGDGSTSVGTITANPAGGFSVTGTHTYSQLGNYALTIQITDDGGASATAHSTATVNGDDTLTASGTTVKPTEGVSFTGVVASFTDSNANATAGNFSASITWGDGSTSAGTISANGKGGFNVSGTHIYAAEGSDVIAVVIHGPNGSSAQATSTATVADSVPVVHASLRHGRNPHEVFLTVNFSDSALENHTLVINWGDGTTTRINLGVSTHGSYIVRHLYHGHFPHHPHIVVTVLDEDGTSSAPVVLTVNFNHEHHHHHHHPHFKDEGSVWNRSDWDGFSWDR